MQSSRNINFKIAFTGIMLSLVLLFQYLEKFMPFGDTFVKLNISLIFIMAAFFSCGFWWAICLLVIRFALGPALGSMGYDISGIWSQLVLLVFGLLFLLTFIASYKLTSHWTPKKPHLRIVLALILAIFITSTFGSFLNAVFLTPGYLWTFKYIDSISLPKAIEYYNQHGAIRVFFFGIYNYWGGTFTVYIVSNIIKYTIISLGFLLIWRALKFFVHDGVKIHNNNI